MVPTPEAWYSNRAFRGCVIPHSCGKLSGQPATRRLLQMQACSFLNIQGARCCKLGRSLGVFHLDFYRGRWECYCELTSRRKDSDILRIPPWQSGPQCMWPQAFAAGSGALQRVAYLLLTGCLHSYKCCTIFEALTIRIDFRFCVASCTSACYK
jgi:hypothetical protein